MRLKYGKHILAVGLSTLLVTSAVSFAASAKEMPSSHAEARYIMNNGTNLGTLADKLGEALEQDGEQACEPAADGCDDEAFFEGLLDPLKEVTVPLGGALGVELGAVNNYAEAGTQSSGESSAASGAVDNNGLVSTGEQGAPSGATINLTNGELPDELAEYLADVEIDLGALASTAEMDQDGTAERDYDLAGATASLTIPALTEVSGQIEEQLGESLGELDQIGTGAVCDALPDEIPGLGEACDLGLGSLLNINTPSINDLTYGLSAGFPGVEVNIDDGSVELDVAKVLEEQGLDLNNLPEETNLIEHIATALDEVVPSILDGLTDDVISTIIDNSSLEIVGFDLPADALNILLDPILEGQEVGGFEIPGVKDALDTALDPLANDVLGTLTGDNGLANLLAVKVNNPDLYTDEGIASGDTPDEVMPGGEQFASETAVRVQVLDALPVDGGAIDLRLGNTQVGPNGTFDDDNADQDQDADADRNDADADQDDNQDQDADQEQDADQVADANAVADSGNNISDADTAADADATSMLPNAGAASNLWPFWLLGLGLVMFGIAALVNEKRRLV